MSRTILGASAVVLLLGVSAVAIAQSGGDARNNDRKIEKALDHQKLTPIRPIRRVGPEDWPAGDPNKRADDADKPKETTGQATAESKSQPNQSEAKQQTPEPAKQDQAKQEPPKQQPNQPANQTAQQQQPAPANQQAQQPAPAQQAQPNNQTQQPNSQSQQANAPGQQQPKQDDFASIRLGTDAQGKVAINDAQEKQIFSALRRQRLRPADVSVKVGAPAPPDVRLGAVSADIVGVLPQFRGYSFFATRDELVIVEPTDKKVVALVPLNGSQIASRPERERTTERGELSTERINERTERSVSRSSSGPSSRRETVGAAVPTEQEILHAPVTGSGRAQTRIEPDDDTVVIERRPHRHRVFGIFRF